MRRLLVFALLPLAVACGNAAPSRRTASAGQSAPDQVRTLAAVDPKPAVIDPPPMLTDEAPPPKPKQMPWDTSPPPQISPEDEKVRSALPFAPAIAMDPVDGSKISIRSGTPTFELKGHIYYFSTEENKRTFVANPEAYTKGGLMKL